MSPPPPPPHPQASLWCIAYGNWYVTHSKGNFRMNIKFQFFCKSWRQWKWCWFWTCDCSQGTTNIKDFMDFCIENVIFLLRFLKNDSFLKFFFPRFKSHFRLVQMTLKSITFVQNHKVIEHFYYNNAHLMHIL